MVPGWAALVGIGALMGASGINFWPVWIAGAIGAALGDWISYWIGYQFKDDVQRMWPLSRYPDLLPSAEKFVATWGMPSIFIGRFSDPCAPSCRSPPASSKCRTGAFRSRTFPRRLVWAAVVLAPGTFGMKMLM